MQKKGDWRHGTISIVTMWTRPRSSREIEESFLLDKTGVSWCNWAQLDEGQPEAPLLAARVELKGASSPIHEDPERSGPDIINGWCPRKRR